MPQITEMSRAFNVTRHTVRRWVIEFGDYLSPGANPEEGEVREFTARDADTLQLVANMRRGNESYEKIHAMLAAGERAEYQPAAVDYEPFNEEESRAIIPQLTAALAHTEGQLEEVREERDYLRGKLESTQQELMDAKTQAAKLQGKIEAIGDLSQKEESSQVQQERPSIWQRLRGKGQS